MKLFFFLPLILLISACTTLEPVVSNNELCGDWIDRELTYRFDAQGNHERIRDGEVYYKATYEVHAEKIIFEDPEGKRTVTDLVILDTQNIQLKQPLPGNGFITTELAHQETCN